MIIPINELYPDYECTDATTGEKYSCEPKDFCDNPDVTAIIDWVSNTSLHNFVEKFDLTCAEPATVGLIGAMFFAGVACSMVYFPRLADIYGRKWMGIAANSTMIPLFGWFVLTNDIVHLYIICFITGLAFAPVYSIGVIYFQELIKKETRVLMVTIL